MLSRLADLDRRIIFVLLFSSVVAAILVPFRLPIRPSPLTRRVFERIESLGRKPGARILVSMDYDPSSKEELNPMAHTLLGHCFRLGIRIVAMTHQPAGVGLVGSVLEEEAKRYGRQYGKDYVYLGYRSGERALIIAMTERFSAAFDRDWRGTPISKLPVASDIRNLGDFNYLMVITHGETLEWWIVYGQDKAHIPVGGGCTAVVAPDLYPWIQTGQLEGLLGGLAGAAEYEYLTGRSGPAMAGMRAQCAAHLLIVLLVFTGNALFLLQRKRIPSYGK